jgi:dihydroneopterin aldolase
MSNSRSALDVIEIKGIKGFGWHGLLEDERLNGQEFIVDVSYWLNTKKAAKSGDVDHTVNYAEVAQCVHDLIVGEPVGLIETLAENIADRVLKIKRIRHVEVTVHKPHAPIPVEFQDVTVSIFRSRK